MAVVNFKSQIVTDLDASPVVKTNQIEEGARVRAKYGTGAFAASDAGSVGRLVRVPSRARVTRLQHATDDLGTGGTLDYGLYRTSADGGAVVDADFFASAVDTDTAAVARTDITYESGVVTAVNGGKRIWEALGLTSDPGVDYDIAATRNAATATGNVSVWLDYVVDE